MSKRSSVKSNTTIPAQPTKKAAVRSSVRALIPSKTSLLTLKAEKIDEKIRISNISQSTKLSVIGI